MAPKAPAETTQTTKVELPDWVEKASESNYNFAKKIAKKPLKQWQGQDVVDPSNMTTDAYDYLMKNIGAQDPIYQNAEALQRRAATENDNVFTEARGILSKASGPWDPSPYLNPYTDEVESRAIANANRSVDRSLMVAGDKARKSGAFGGSASAIEKGILAAEGARGIGDLSAELRAAGYDKATSDLIADRESKRGIAGDMVNSANAQNTGWLNAATGMLGTASERGKSVLSDVSAMFGAGANDEKYRQSVLEGQKAKFYEKRDYPLEKLNILLSSLGMSPYGKTETVNKTATSESQGPDFATAGLGIMQMLLPMLSDRRDKKDIEKLGVDEETGLDIYAYRYKDADAGSPKVVGPMAQDVEKKYPKAVREIGGHKVIFPAGMLSAA